MEHRLGESEAKKGEFDKKKKTTTREPTFGPETWSCKLSFSLKVIGNILQRMRELK